MSPGKGLAVFATGSVPKDTPLRYEYPIMDLLYREDWTQAEWGHHLQAAFDNFTQLQIQALLALDEVKEYGGIEEAMNANRFMHAVPDEGEERLYMGVYPGMSRVNHSCAPNCRVYSREGDHKLLILESLRDIEAGEELTFAYLPEVVGLGVAARQQMLEENCRFKCECAVCSGEGEEEAENH